MDPLPGIALVNQVVPHVLLQTLENSEIDVLFNGVLVSQETRNSESMQIR